jgi:predicted lipoprotein
LGALLAVGALDATVACSTTDPPENYLATRGVIDPDASGGPATGGPTSNTNAGEAPGGTGGTNDPDSPGAAGESTTLASGGSGGGRSGVGGSGGGGPVVVDVEAQCGPAPVSSAEFTKQRLRGAAADCAMHHFCLFEGHAENLREAVVSHVQEESERSLEHARDMWKQAMGSWSRLELFQFGPMANPAVGAGKDTFQGQGIRERIYAWPSVARCRVDEQVLGRGFVDQGMDGVLISGRGLFALESLLFYEGTGTACTSPSMVDAWDALPVATLEAYRQDYAVAVGDDVVDLIQHLSRLWSPEGDDFRESFVTFDGYPSEQEAMNVLGWALVYVEKEVKDYKLGIPAGYTLTAPVSQPEALYAGIAHHNIENNLLGFRSLFQGCGDAGVGLGFDDWLVAAGHSGLADDIIAAWQTAHASVKQLPPLEQADPSEVDAAFLAVKALTDLLKNELLGAGSPLNLDLPATVEGDTD